MNILTLQHFSLVLFKFFSVDIVPSLRGVIMKKKELEYFKKQLTQKVEDLLNQAGSNRN